MTAPAPYRTARERLSGAPVGRLELAVDVRAGRSVAVRQYHHGALRVIRPHYLDRSGQVSYTVVNPGGGYLGGDRYEIDVEVAPGAELLLTTQSATKVYRTPQGPAVQETAVRLGAGALLENVPDALIAYREATYRQRTRVDMHPEACLITSEVVTPGWAPDASRFGYDEVRLATEVRVAGRPVVVDRLLIRRGDAALSARAPLFLAGRTHVGTMLAMHPDVDDALLAELREELGEAVRTVARTPSPSSGPEGAPARPLDWGLSRTNGTGLAVRVLGDDTESVTRLLTVAGDRLRARWHGRGPLDLRKH